MAVALQIRGDSEYACIPRRVALVVANRFH